MAEKKKIKLQDLSFVGQTSSSKYHDSKYIEWDRSASQDNMDLVFFTDMCLPYARLPQYNKSTKIAWLVEPFLISPNVYLYIEEHCDDFDLVLSHHEAVSVVPNYKWYPCGGCWIKEEDWQIYDKSKRVSTIASDKRITVGHNLRHSYIKEHGHKIEVFGLGYNPIDYKLSALKDFRFSVTIENSQADLYFTEKLIDCFVTGTIPIYWGSDKIDSIFNKDGIIMMNDEFLNKSPEDKLIIPKFPDDITFSKREQAIKDNFEIAKKYVVGEDVIFTDILKPLGLV